jgi:hypothetical protein
MPPLPAAVREWWRKLQNLVSPDDKHPKPMEVYHALLREGERNVMIVLDRAVAPNCFVCHIIPSDANWQRNLEIMLEPERFAARLTADLKARRRDFLGAVKVEFHYRSPGALREGEERIKVEIAFDRAPQSVPSDGDTERVKPPPVAPGDTELAQPIACLMAITGALKGQMFELSRSPFRIGRDPKENDLRLPQSDLKASRKHATLTRGAGGVWRLQDHSRNGTHVKRRPGGGKRSTWVKLVKDATVLLTPGAQFKISETVFVCIGADDVEPTRLVQ